MTEHHFALSHALLDYLFTLVYAFLRLAMLALFRIGTAGSRGTPGLLSHIGQEVMPKTTTFHQFQDRSIVEGHLL